MGNRSDTVYDWKVDTLSDMPGSLRTELEALGP